MIRINKRFPHIKITQAFYYPNGYRYIYQKGFILLMKEKKNRILNCKTKGKIHQQLIVDTWEIFNVMNNNLITK